MTKTGIIYKVTSPSGKAYIGQTTQSLSRRKKQHRYLCKKMDTPFYRALRKYMDKMKWEILHEDVFADKLYALEMLEIKKHNAFGDDGYNATPGGEGYSGIFHPLFGKKFTKESRAKMSLAHSGSRHHFFGKNLSESVKDKIALSLGCKFGIYKKGKLIKIYNNQNTCAKDFNLLRCAISMCLSGNRKSHRGYTFRHEQ